MKVSKQLSPKRLVLILALLGAVIYSGVALRPKPADVETARATRGPLTVTVDEDGVTRIHHRYVVGAPVDGRLERITLHPGDGVAAGGVVAWLDPVPLDPRTREQAQARLAAAQAAQREADAGVRRARAAQEQVERTRRRMDRLAAEKVIAADQAEEARTAALTAESDLAAAQFRARAAELGVENARAALIETGGAGTPHSVPVRSPVDGLVLKVCEECDKVVPTGTALIELGSPAELEVVIDVLSSDAVGIRNGAPMLLDAGGGVRLRARVSNVEPAGFTKVSPLGVEEQRVNVIGAFVDPPRGLGDRYRVDAKIVLWQGGNVLKIPTGALFREGQAWAVYTVEKGRAVRHPVTIGHRNPDETEILAGIKEGETVIVHPSDAVAEGGRVKGDGAGR